MVFLGKRESGRNAPFWARVADMIEAREDVPMIVKELARAKGGTSAVADAAEIDAAIQWARGRPEWVDEPDAPLVINRT